MPSAQARASFLDNELKLLDSFTGEFDIVTLLSASDIERLAKDIGDLLRDQQGLMAASARRAPRWPVVVGHRAQGAT